MIRTVVYADTRSHTKASENKEVGNGFRTWNDAIRATVGTIVYGSLAEIGPVELWCDDEALLFPDPIRNDAASIIARQDIYGDVIIFFPGDIK